MVPFKSKGNNPRYRKWCIVIHNVRDLPEEIKASFKTAIRLAYSVEPYNHQTGNHVYIFAEFKNPRYKHALLKDMNVLSSSLRDPEASGEGSIGRVQLEQMRGNFDQAMKYLVDPDKDKKLGEAELIDRTAEREASDLVEHWSFFWCVTPLIKKLQILDSKNRLFVRKLQAELNREMISEKNFLSIWKDGWKESLVSQTESLV